jgi:Protein of unknown function (DUF4232)
MDGLERLTDAGRRLVAEFAPNTPPATIAVHEARLRRQRRLALGGLAAAILGAVLTIGFVVSRPDHEAPPQLSIAPPPTKATQPPGSTHREARTPPIPWSPTRGTPNARYEFAQTLPAPAGNWPDCAVPSLRFELRTNSIAQALNADLVIKNVSNSTCALRGRPGVVLLNQSLQVRGRSAREITGAEVVLVPTSWAYASLGTLFQSTCAETGTVRVDIATGTTDLVVGPFPPSRCPKQHRVESLAVQAFADLPESVGYRADYQLSSVKLRLVVTERAHPGATLHYVVVMSNKDPNGMALAPPYCPLFAQSLSGVSPGVYELNCGFAGGTQIPAGGSVAFAMQFVVPQGVPAGTHQLEWRLVEPDGPSVSTSLSVQ